ncbi:hypothetical protein NEMBOFW57_010696 [Staphylotrichum longicolle]|uniref:Heterokaryon incompatibility domain-containing protein n=1 Tax=Staphylotrichum longicolle TaxID=669026 RepID=A0AAD4EN74_9PEZI|nr:hypothetical protein NEMBOFW57_010696 [Staphylotrichum longicolle]
MRLINTRTFEVKEFIGDPPSYAILSHMWDDDEVTFQDMAALPAARKKKGFAKIEQCCKQAVRHYLDWAWVDTCCIDKSSSAELSESINSMFRWYKRARKCYAFLGDVDEAPVLDSKAAPAAVEQDNPSRPALVPDNLGLFCVQMQLSRSRWWKRGWTLQELIAPYNVEFYNCRWEFLTSKRANKRFISATFAIPEPILDHSDSLSSVCVADRIAWAAGRKTTREEDMAYSLLGILGVNMPLLYGEGGRRAFVRLQEQTIAASEDYTLFLWGHSTYRQFLVAESAEASPRVLSRPIIGGAGSSMPVNAMLASSPDDFRTKVWWSGSRVEPVTRRHGPLLSAPRPAQVVDTDIDTYTNPLSALYCETLPPSPPPEPDPPCIEIVLEIRASGVSNSEVWSEGSVDGEVDCRP